MQFMFEQKNLSAIFFAQTVDAMMNQLENAAVSLNYGKIKSYYTNVFSSLIPLFYPFGKSGCEYKKNAGNFESDETSF